MTQPDIKARIADLQHRILDGAGNVLDSLALQSARRAAVSAALYGEIAALTCTRMACRRAHRCRGEPLACIKRAREFVAANSVSRPRDI
jgi:hypothetical protein